MWLVFVLAVCFSGPLVAVQGSLFRDLFKSLDTEPDDCGKRVVECEHYKQPLHPMGNSGQVMFTDPMELESACSEMMLYLHCVNLAEKFCQKISHSPIDEKMLRNRLFASEVCKYMSSSQLEYIKHSACINEHISEAIEVCMEEEIAYQGSRYRLDRPENVCKNLKMNQNCRSRKISEKCGATAGNIMQKLMHYRDGMEFECSEFDESTLKGLERPVFFSVSDTIAQRIYPDFISKLTGVTDETTLDSVEQDESSITTPESHQSEISENKDADQIDATTQPSVSTPSEETITFGLYLQLKRGGHEFVGCGKATVVNTTLTNLDQPLKLLWCSWTSPADSQMYPECTVKINERCLREEKSQNSRDSSKDEFSYGEVFLDILREDKKTRFVKSIMVLSVKCFNPYFSETASLWHTPLCPNTVKHNMWSRMTANAEEKLKDIHRFGTMDFENRLGELENARSDKETSCEHPESECYVDEERNLNWPTEKQIDIEDLLERARESHPVRIVSDVVYVKDVEDNIPLQDHDSPVYRHSGYNPYSQFLSRKGRINTEDSIWTVEKEELKHAKRVYHTHGFSKEASSEHVNEQEKDDAFSFPYSSESPRHLYRPYRLFRPRTGDIEDESVFQPERRFDSRLSMKEGKGYPKPEETVSRRKSTSKHSEYDDQFCSLPENISRPRNRKSKSSIYSGNEWERERRLQENLIKDFEENVYDVYGYKTGKASEESFVVTPSAEMVPTIKLKWYEQFSDEVPTSNDACDIDVMPDGISEMDNEMLYTDYTTDPSTTYRRRSSDFEELPEYTTEQPLTESNKPKARVNSKFLDQPDDEFSRI
ncbi:hypothetical protein CDAR_608721 [Caerostris darwini]|uniref:Uncharacterized protein n=1 Tax=Caerostris darwini TaxID=1538125 RepID=A0AAV4WIU1_9ARAC|nr:hypothetical protein CDAR_608721 [Caerostris darwini]